MQGKHCGCSTSTVEQGAWFHLELDIAGREDLDLCTYEDWGTAVWDRTALRPRHHILRGSVLFPWLHVSTRTQCTIVPGDAVSPTGLESCKHQIYCLRDRSLEQAASCQTVQGDCGAIPSTPLPYRLPVSFILRSKRGYGVTSHSGAPSQERLSHHPDSQETIERTVQSFSFQDSLHDAQLKTRGK